MKTRYWNNRNDHRYFADLLPWYVNKTLPETEAQGVKDHLNTCLICRTRVESLGTIFTRLTAIDVVSPIKVSDPEEGFAKVMARIKSEPLPSDSDIDIDAEVKSSRQVGWVWQTLGNVFSMPTLAAAEFIGIAVLAILLSVSLKKQTYQETLMAVKSNEQKATMADLQKASFALYETRKQDEQQIFLLKQNVAKLEQEKEQARVDKERILAQLRNGGGSSGYITSNSGESNATVKFCIETVNDWGPLRQVHRDYGGEVRFAIVSADGTWRISVTPHKNQSIDDAQTSIIEQYLKPSGATKIQKEGGQVP